MGVHFLQTFMEEKVPGGYKKVNIAKIAKAENGSRSNVLVIDLNAMACKPFGMFNMREVVKKDINGGDFVRYKDAWIKILDRLEKAGIKAIFVCDGGLPDSRRKVWIKRRYGKMKSDIIPMLNSIRQGQYPNLHRVAPNKYRAAKLLMYELGYEDSVLTSTHNQDGDKACAGIIEKYNAFGVLTDDSDFLIHQFSSDVFVFSIKDLNLKTLDTKVYDKQKLANYLGLSLTQLPIFATLKGNDILSSKDLTKFHQSLGSNDGFELVSNVAAFIKKECQNSKPDSLAAMLGLKIFNNPNKAVIIQESLNSYELTEENLNNPLGTVDVHEETSWSRLIENASDYGSKAIQLMCGAPFDWGCCLEDYSGKSTLPKVAELMKGPRQRMYGILFLEKQGALNENESDFLMKVEELAMTGPGSLNPSKMVKPTMPPKEDHPGLEALWNGKKEREFHFDLKKSMAEMENETSGGCHKLRWRLFSWIINPNLVNLEHTLKQNGLDETDLFMICQLYIMQHELEMPILTKKEVQTFILVNYRLKNLSNKEVMNIPTDFVPESRPVELATIYWRSMLDTFSDCVGDIVARKYFLPYNKFDGTLFQIIYWDFQENNNDADITKYHGEEVYVNSVYRIVTSSGEKIAKQN